MRSKVDLPHPEGPTKTKNSPSAISRLISSRITVPSKAFPTFESLNQPMPLAYGFQWRSDAGQVVKSIRMDGCLKAVVQRRFTTQLPLRLARRPPPWCRCQTL